MRPEKAEIQPTTAPLPDTADAHAKSPNPARGMTIGRAAWLGMLGSAGTVVFSLARSKVTAIVLGPDGVGLSAEVLQLATFTFVPLGTILGTAYLKGLAQARSDGNSEGARAVTSAAFSTAAATIPISTAVAGLMGALLLPSFEGKYLLLFLGIIATALQGFIRLPGQVLTVEERLSELTRTQLIGGALTTAAIVAGTYVDGLRGQFAGFAIGAFLALAVTWIAAARLPSGLRVAWRYDPEYIREAVTIGVAALVSGFSMQGALVLIRLGLESWGGASAVGQFQAAWAIGFTYFGLVLTGLSSYVFPRYAAAKTPQQLGEEIGNAARFVLTLAPPVVLLAIAFRDVAMHVLYSDQFSTAADILGPQMAADVAKALSWVLAGPLLYRGKVREFIVVEVLGAALIAAGPLILLPKLGPIATGYGYLAAYALYLPATSWIVARTFSIRIPPRWLLSAYAWTAAALAANWLTEWSIYGRIATGLIGGALAALMLRRTLRRSTASGM